jgi:hypothetical protein
MAKTKTTAVAPVAAGDGWLILLCPPGAADGLISHGDVSYHSYRADHTVATGPWLVKVPIEVAKHLLWNGGFTIWTDPK